MMIMLATVLLGLLTGIRDDSDIAVIINRYVARLPPGVSARYIAPNVAVSDPTYVFEKSGLQIWLSVLPYQLSKSTRVGECTVSAEADQHAGDGPIFCEGETLTRTLKTKLGPAKWIEGSEDATSGMQTMNSAPYTPPANKRYSHRYLVVIPVKADDAILEFSLSFLGTKDHAGTPAEERMWPLLRDQILPSLQRY